ncbi:hypothetical protein MIMGU_mgv1a021423mg [Erythranthe guttata]|uniref:Cytochrome P450 n=1 Tax=Erythranthe guttata TaxID=4155 RepID=A0A022QHZ9_ERYGU|nr:PREDICTED: alkane hydroxylase MAH1-like [Erythranthe guttata]EYU27556.1 hypothetical protein MIMGU_mgv1a021423mg [Erythranthe guttata]|eukprot:XP_012848386.1 PREDICTED: alkane hydroxylase MAH1-like [Erythranthe guttata]
MYTAIILLVIFIYLPYHFYRNYFHARKDKKSSPAPPPTDWPIFGMLPGLLLNCGRVHTFMTELLESSGGTFYLKGAWFANMSMLITSDPANVHYILAKNFPNFEKGPQFKKMFDVLGDGIFNAESESWEIQKRTAKSLMHNTSFPDFIARTSWSKVENALIPILELASETGTEVDLQELFQRFAFDCSCITVLGHDPVSLCKELPHLPHEKAFADAEQAVLYRHMLPEFTWKLQSWLHIGKENELTKAKDVIHRFVSDCISMKHQDFNLTGPKDDGLDMLTSCMRARADEGINAAPNNYSDEVWKDTLLNLIFAGKDTISAALAWFFWLVATNPAEQEKIRREIDDTNWRFTTIEESKKLVYLHGALCETLRLFPPVPFQHKAPVEHDILPSGHRISPNTKTVLSFYSMGRMESIWGNDCLDFKPGRWIDPETGRVRTEPSFKFTAFNAGPRSCLGKDVSFIQLKIVAAAIVSRFNIRVARGFSVTPSISVILHMKHGLKVKVSDFA